MNKDYWFLFEIFLYFINTIYINSRESLLQTFFISSSSLNISSSRYTSRRISLYLTLKHTLLASPNLELYYCLIEIIGVEFHFFVLKWEKVSRAKNYKRKTQKREGNDHCEFIYMSGNLIHRTLQTD